MPLPRMTTRRWMIAVAVGAVLLGLVRRYEYLEGCAEYHDSRTTVTLSGTSKGSDGERHGPSAEELERGEAEAAWHAQMAKKHRRAACYFWLPVPPDWLMPRSERRVLRRP